MYPELTQKRTISEATRVTVVGMVLDLVLGVAKIVGGLLANSFAVVTDGVHSLSDAFSDVFVLAVVRISGADPDAEHPYGHGRFETLGTIAMGLLFFCTAAIILYDAGQRLVAQEYLATPTALALIITVASIVGKEWIFHYTMAVAKRVNSSLLKANAWHSRSDAISSVAVLAGLLGARMGYLWMDLAAAMFVALIIAKIGWELCYDSVRELVDTALPAEKRGLMRQQLLATPGVHSVTGIRSRSSGGQSIVEVSISVDPRISVSEGHSIGEACSRTLTGRFEDIRDVIVHIDPDSGVHGIQRSQREQLLAAIRESWQGLLHDEQIERIELHCLEQGIEAELVLDGSADEKSLQRLVDKLRQSQLLDSLRIYSLISESSFKPPLSS